MRYGILVAVMTLAQGAGCTHLALERRTVNQASTTTDLQYRQVLDNIAMFACNPDALPWHLKLQGASIQVADSGTASLEDAVSGGALPSTFTFTPALNAQRGVVNQWSGIPTVESEILELLMLAYRKAIDPEDQEGHIREALFRNIVEIAVLNNLVLAKDTLDKAIDSNRSLEKTKAWQLKRRNEDLHEQLDKVFEQVAKLSRPITEVQVDNYAQRLSNKVTEETRGEARAKLQAQQAQQSAQVQQTRISVEDEIVRMTRDLCSLPYIPRYPITGRPEHNSHDIALAQYKIKALLDLAESPKFAEPWVCVAGGHQELSKCGGYIGRHDKRGSRCRIYVPPARLATLRDFTLIVLALAPIEAQESPSGTTTGTVTYSPLIGAGR